MDNLVLFQIFDRMLFTTKSVSCGSVTYGLYYVEVGSLYAYFLGSFFFLNHKWMLNFVKSLFYLY